MQEVESHLEGDLEIRGLLNMDPNVRPGYQGIRMAFRIKADASPEELQELLESVHSFSPVFNSISQGVPIAVTMMS